MPLTSTKIYKCITYSNTYQKGERYYRDGRVLDFTINESGYESLEGFEYIQAVVRGSDDYAVTINLDNFGNILDYSCECEAYKCYDGACKHITATLIYRLNFYENLMMPQNAFGKPNEMKIGKTRNSDSGVHLMINQYVKNDILQLQTELLSNEEMVSLNPVIVCDHSNIDLSLTIGRARKYVVKNINDLCYNVITQTEIEYGKLFKFDNNINAFDEKSKLLMKFLINRYKSNMSEHSSYYRYNSGGANSNKTIQITSTMLDRIFDIYIGDKLYFKFSDGMDGYYTCCERDIKVPLKVTKVEGGVSVSCHGVTAFGGEAYCYIIDGDMLCRCSSSYKDFYDNFMQTILAKKNKLFISNADLTDFFSIVIPSISDYVNVVGKTDYLEDFLPDKITTELYLDAIDKNTITALLNFCYGSIRINSFDNTVFSDIKRDKFSETKAKGVVTSLFKEVDTEHGYYRFDGDDAQLFNFVSDILPKLFETFTVFATDGFKKLRILPPTKAAIGVSVTSNLLEIDIKDIGFPIEELDEILSGYRQNKKYHRLKDGSFLSLDNNSIESVAQLIDGLDISKKQLKSGKFPLPMYRAMFVDSLMHGDENISFTRDSHFKELIRTMKSVEDNDFSLPQSLQDTLRNYQKTGVNWLKTVELCGFSGILADDMGLGKTLQVITLLLSAKEQEVNMPSIVVCPSSLVLNWCDEFEKFAPAMKVLPVMGNAKKRIEDIESVSRYDVVITSYDLLKRDIFEYENIEFYYQIIDEAQFIKNHTTKAAQGTKGINSRYRCALTGTPIENRISELWSIFDFLMPMYLYNYSKFKEKFELPIVKNNDEVALNRLQKMVKPFILRRLKRDVLKELPEKTETIMYTSMEEEQEKIYLANLINAREEMGKNSGQTNKLAIFAMLTRLRQLCCDPALCYDNYNGGSGKLNACMDLLHDAISGGHKILLFSQFTSMLSIIEKKLINENISYFKLQGDTKKERRHDMVETFNNDDTNVFLISLKAGGTGLNLTSADVVIHYDPWWNLAAQNQATDRAHRIGQNKSVSVYKLIAKDTIEEKIVKLQLSKKDLVDSVIKEGEGLLTSITANELMELL